MAKNIFFSYIKMFFKYIHYLYINIYIYRQPLYEYHDIIYSLQSVLASTCLTFQSQHTYITYLKLAILTKIFFFCFAIWISATTPPRVFGDA